MRGAISAAQEAAEEHRAGAAEQARDATAAQEALQQRLEQMQAEAAALEAAKGGASKGHFAWIPVFPFPAGPALVVAITALMTIIK